MVFDCRKICKKIKAKGRYGKGNRYCRFCKIFIKFEGFFCPCCGHRLKSRPASSIRRKAHDQKTGYAKRY